MNRFSNSNSTSALILTFLFPFAGLIYTLSNWRASWAKNAFWMICIYLGAVQIFLPEGTILGEGADAGRMVLRLMEWHNSGITLKQILAGFMVDTYTMDLYQPLLTFLVSRFTDNGHVLMGIGAIVFGFFYSRNIWYVLEKLPNKPLGYLFILVTLFFLINPITNINGLRYNTAIHIFLYAMLPYLCENRKDRLWWLLAVLLVHFSFLYVVIMALAYVFLIPYRTKYNGKALVTVSMILFIGTLFINTLNLSSIKSVLEAYSPDAYEERIDLYVNQDVADSKAESSATVNWYVGASGTITHWAYSLLLIFFFPCVRRNIMTIGNLYNLYAFALLFGSLANIMSLIPSGGRFLLVSYFLIISLVLMSIMKIPPTDSYRGLLQFSSIFLLIPMIVSFRRLFDFYGINAVLGNFITMFFWESNVPLIEFIKNIVK